MNFEIVNHFVPIAYLVILAVLHAHFAKDAALQVFTLSPVIFIKKRNAYMGSERRSEGGGLLQNYGVGERVFEIGD